MSKGKQISTFDLDDLDSFVSMDISDKNKVIVPVLRTIPPQTRSKSTPKKRKAIAAATSCDNVFEGLPTHEALSKAELFIQQCVTQIRTNDEDISLKLEQANHDLQDALEKNKKLVAANTKMLEDHQKALLKERESMEAKQAEALQKIKKSAAKVVFECRVKMYEQVADKEFDLSKWDIKSFEEEVGKVV